MKKAVSNELSLGGGLKSVIVVHFFLKVTTKEGERNAFVSCSCNIAKLVLRYMASRYFNCTSFISLLNALRVSHYVFA